jgi:hypothetical protein
MSEENVEVVRRCFELANERNLDAVVDLYDDGTEDRVIVRHIWRGPGDRRGAGGELETTLAARLRRNDLMKAPYSWDHADAVGAVGLEP